MNRTHFLGRANFLFLVFSCSSFAADELLVRVDPSAVNSVAGSIG